MPQCGVVRFHTLVSALTCVAACGSQPGSTKQAPAESPTASSASALAADAGLVEVPEPPQLACEPGAQAVAAPAPEPTWYCTRPDGAKHGAVITLFPDHSIEIRGTYKHDALDGPWERRHASGAILEQGTYVAGLKDGTWRQTSPSGTPLGEYTLVAGSGVEQRWYEDGPLYSELTLKAGVPDGPARQLARDGVLINQMRFANGLLDGAHAFGTRNTMRFEETFAAGVLRGRRKIWLAGLLIADESYNRNGKRDGTYTSWRSNKIARITGEYANGRRTGEWIWNDRNGKQERAGRYSNGKRDGVWNEWDQDKLIFTGTYDVGKPIGDFVYYDRKGNELGRYTMQGGTGVALTFHASGRPSSKQRLFKGVEDGVYQELTPRGKLLVEGHYANGTKHGTWKEWNADGVIVLEQRWKRGKLDGVVKKYVDGKISLEAHYVDGTAEGSYTELRLGKPSVTGQFAGDLRTGTWTHHNADGAIVLTATYKAGALDGTWREVVASPPGVLEGQMTAGRRSGTWTRTDPAGGVRKLTYRTP